MPTTITINCLTKTFGRASRQVKAVDHANLVIDPGEIFFLLGPSGCGKTTLLRMIAGFIQPTSGTIHFNERDVTRVSPNKRNAGMVFQSYALWPHMTALGNVSFGLKVRKLNQEIRNARAREALQDVQLQPLADRKPGELSGGQQQRVALARALVIRPDVLLLDEPLSNLDARLRSDLREEIRRICKDAGITTVYVTHDQKEALSIADRIAVMRDGKIVQAGTPMELYRRPTSIFTASFLGETNLISGSIDLILEQSGLATVSTPIGLIQGQLVSSAKVGQAATVSIRPEHLKALADGQIRCEVVSTSYLGDVAHHRVKTEGGPVLHVSEFAPSPSSHFRGHIRLDVKADDAVVIPQ